jgi:heptosyltransferase-2
MQAEKYKNIDRMLLISLSCIGDVILTTPVMKSLKDNFPGAKLTVVTGPTASPLLSRHEWVDAICVYENRGRHAGFRGAMLFVRELRGAHFDLAVDLRNTAFPYFLHSRHRIAAHRAHIRNQNVKSRHAIDRHLDVLELAGIHPTTRRIYVTIPADVEKRVLEKMRPLGLADPPKSAIAVYPSAGSPYKLYPADKLLAALDSLSGGAELCFALIGSAADRDVCESVARGIGGRAANLAGELDILETGALLRNCRMLISNDSGPMHLAVAVDTPTVAVFGPTNAERYGPRGEMHRIVWHREPCNPCKFPDCGRDTCISDVPPESIAAAACELLNSNG